MRFKDDLERLIYYHSQIDYCYWRISEISKHTGKSECPMDAMVDAATGFDKALVKARIKEVKYLVKTIIRLKPKIGFEPTGDKEFLKAINVL